MARLSLDPKPIFNIDLFGSEDLKLYAEMAILGLQDYPVYYDTLWQRIPLVIGFNLPAFKQLDVLSFEWEWYGSRYPNSYQMIYDQLRPIPEQATKDFSPKDDDEKWSVYAKRSLIKGKVALVGQVSRDHLRLVHFQDDLAYIREAITKKDHWQWVLKAQFGF